MTDETEGHRQGTYTTPFTQVQYGAFVKRGGVYSFTSTGYTEEMARANAVSCYERMNKFPDNYMDMDALNDIRIKQRVVTYDVWTEVLTD